MSKSSVIEDSAFTIATASMLLPVWTALIGTTIDRQSVVELPPTLVDEGVRSPGET